MKRYKWILLLLLTLGVMACTDDDVVSKGMNIAEKHDAPEPDDDQMGVRVTADLKAYTFAAFDEGSTGAALVKRLPQASDYLGPDTRLMLFRGSDFDSGSTLTEGDIMAMSRIYRQGGFIALERPTVRQFAQFALTLMTGILTIKQNELERTFGMSAAAAAAAARQSQAVERINARVENIRQMAAKTDTRAGEALDENRVMGEMMVFNPTGYFMQQPFETNPRVIVHAMDSQGNMTVPETMTATVARTPYISGKMADAVATWLNDMLKPKLNSPLTARRRANGNNNINEIMSASETFTYSSAIDYRDEDNKTCTLDNRMNMTVRSWNVHNMESNKDFYYLQQDVKLMLGEKDGKRLYNPDDYPKDSWWMNASMYVDYDKWFGAFLSQYETSMNLTGDGGTIRLESAMPTTSNDGGTVMISTGTSSGSSTVNGIALNGMAGVTPAGMVGSFTPTGIHSEGTTQGTSFLLMNTSVTYGLNRKVDTDGTKVAWTYEGSLPTFYLRNEGDTYYSCHDDPIVILINDADMTQQICWSVANPTGAYTAEITSTPQTAALMFSYANWKEADKAPPHCYQYTTTETSTFTHTLLEPNRYMQNWRMFITIDEWADQPVGGALSQLTASVQNAFPDLYASQFQLADKTAESMDMINNLVAYSKYKFDQGNDILQSYAQDLGIKRFSIYWRCDDRNIETQEPYVVEVPEIVKPGYVAQVVWCAGNKTLYFIFAAEKKTGDTWDGQTVDKVWTGTDVTHSSTIDYPEWWWELHSKVTRLVFDKSFADVRPRSCFAWFCYFSYIETIEGIGNLNTSEVTDMSYMFHSLEKLTALDVDGFDMSKVTAASEMFCLCKNLETIYCSQTWNIASSYDMFASCDKLKGAASYNRKKADCTMANPETGYFTWPGFSGTVTLNENSRNSALLKRIEGQMANVDFNRRLTARIGDDGNYMPTPFTVCLPYDLDLTEAVGAGQVEIYTLAAVSNGQFNFAKLGITTLEAGVPYLLRVMNGSISLGADKVTIKTAKPGSTKVYSSLAAWRRQSGTEVGVWVGTFDHLTADDAADESAYSLQAADGNWSGFTYGGTTDLPAFRAYLSAPGIEKKEYTTRFTE